MFTLAPSPPLPSRAPSPSPPPPLAPAYAISQNPTNPFLQNALNFLVSNFCNYSSPSWVSLSLAADPSPITDPRTGVSDSTGVYADDGDIKKVLGEKYGNISVSELKEKNKELFDDLMESDICMTVRLQIVYGRLSIRSVRSAFEESVGTRLQKFGGADNKELLQR
ncbi:Fatty-acid-binding protein 1 [Camellia lanceoleosa]|uniref:Fatty-acid-binding protein 1 n=1 Tax=Camellia lanceoleosa TaxID=1840588 RepID=A0ACC0F295_9ERIC|nr:Fatty-acid-binding protein 1 [Camellia lanceoleosa]